MRILLLSHIFPKAIDGGSKVIYKLGQYFESQQHQTLYISSDCSSTDDFVKKIQHTSPPINQKIIKLPVYHHLRRPLKFLNLFLKSDFLKVLQKGPIFKIIPFIKTVIKIIKFNPDLIVAGPLPTTIVLYGNFFKKITKSKLLINSSFHPTDFDFQQKPLIKSLQSANFLWTLTQFETDYFIKNFNIDPKKIILAGNGVDSNFLLKRSKITTNKPTTNLLFIGSLSAHKRVDLLIQSFSNFISPKISLTIAGQKTLFYPQIEKLVNSLDPKIKSQIKFIFDFPQNDLINLIDNCDVLVFPSIQESFGLVVIESWARQKPVICADIPALKELVTKSNGGLLFKTDDQTDLAKKIEFIFNHPKKAKELGKNGYEYVKNNYTWKKVGDKICQKILF
ncbi:MAG TPA: glycosyltransferase family 4 protein [Candidatus Woesebacteria bacterium]|nr:glycosyltransferase family 4 protein [Candidatus Woesebacteria bacterium]